MQHCCIQNKMSEKGYQKGYHWNTRTKKSPQSRASLANMVGTMRFELMTPSTPRKCATKLRYVPNTYGLTHKPYNYSLSACCFQVHIDHFLANHSSLVILSIILSASSLLIFFSSRSAVTIFSISAFVFFFSSFFVSSSFAINKGFSSFFSLKA